MSEQRLIWLYERMMEMEEGIGPTHYAVMAALLAREAQGLGNITKADLGALVGIKERQVSNVLKDLEGEIVEWIKKRRNGGTGKGRAPNAYEVRPDATGNPVPATWRRQTIADSDNQQSSAGNAVPSASPDQHSNAGNEVLVAVQIDDEIPPKDKYQTPLEINPEGLELASNNSCASETPPKVLNGSARGMNSQQLAAVVFEHVNSPWLDPNRWHTLGTSAGTLSALIEAGADFDLDILPTIKRVMAGKREHIRSFGYFEDAIREHAARRMAAEATRDPINALEALNDKFAGDSQRSDYTRRKRDPVFDAIRGIETRR